MSEPSVVSQELVRALQKHVGELTTQAEAARREKELAENERRAVIKLKAETVAELAQLRRDHEAEMAAGRDALARDQAAFESKVKAFVALLEGEEAS